MNGERRSFALLRPIVDTTAQNKIRELIPLAEDLVGPTASPFGFLLLFIVHPLLSLLLYLPLRDAHDGTDPGLLRFFAMRFYVTDVFATLFLRLFR